MGLIPNLHEAWKQHQELGRGNAQRTSAANCGAWGGAWSRDPNVSASVPHLRCLLTVVAELHNVVPRDQASGDPDLIDDCEFRKTLHDCRDVAEGIERAQEPDSAGEWLRNWLPVQTPSTPSAVGFFGL